MSFDVTGLHPIPMKKANNSDWRGTYYVLKEDHSVCIAKTCSTCREVLPATAFGVGSSKKFDLLGKCRDCNSSDGKVWYYTDADGRHRGQVYGLARGRKDLGGVTYAAQIKQNERARNSIRTDDEVLARRKELHPTGRKACDDCRADLPLTEYNSQILLGDGLQRVCKDCDGESRKNRRTKPYRTYWESHGVPYECYISGATLGLHSDHVIPAALEGPDDAYNRLPLRGDLNCSKQEVLLLPWLLERRDLAEYGPRGLVLTRVLGYGVWPFLESPEYVSEHWDEWSENADNIYNEWLAEKEAASVL